MSRKSERYVIVSKIFFWLIERVFKAIDFGSGFRSDSGFESVFGSGSETFISVAVPHLTKSFRLESMTVLLYFGENEWECEWKVWLLYPYFRENEWEGPPARGGDRSCGSDCLLPALPDCQRLCLRRGSGEIKIKLVGLLLITIDSVPTYLAFWILSEWFLSCRIRILPFSSVAFKVPIKIKIFSNFFCCLNLFFNLVY